MVAGPAKVVEFVGFRPHTRKDGSETKLTVLRRECCDCNEHFEFTQALGGRAGVDLVRMYARCQPCRDRRRKPACEHPGAQRHSDGSLACLMCRAPVTLRGGGDEPWRLETREPSNLDNLAPARAEGLAVSP